jgi:hypothetical protein
MQTIDVGEGFVSKSALAQRLNKSVSTINRIVSHLRAWVPDEFDWKPGQVLISTRQAKVIAGVSQLLDTGLLYDQIESYFLQGVPDVLLD